MRPGVGHGHFGNVQVSQALHVQNVNGFEPDPKELSQTVPIAEWMDGTDFLENFRQKLCAFHLSNTTMPRFLSISWYR